MAGPGTFSGALFDMDGVLVDTGGAITALWQRLAADHDLTLGAEDMRRNVFGCAPEHTVETVFAALTDADRRRVLAKVVAAEPDLDFDELPGAGALVGELDRAGVLLGLVTGASARRVGRVLDAMGLSCAFSGIVAWGDVPRGKPAPDCYLAGACRIGLPPEDCVVFEDAASGVRAATDAGATCVGIGDEGLAEHGAWAVVASAAELRCRSGRWATAVLHGESVVATFTKKHRKEPVW